MASARTTIPTKEIESLAKSFLPEILAFFETEEGNRQYEEWLKEEETKGKAKKEIKFGE